MIRIVNLYAGLGGNRIYWDKEHLGDEIRVFAVENNPMISKEYKEMFPKDKMWEADAHKFLVENLKMLVEKDVKLLWISPPCQTHSKAKFWRYYKDEPYYQDFKLYELIHLLQNQKIWDGKWVVENVTPFYKPLIPYTKKIERHLFWANFNITDFTVKGTRRAYNELGNKELRAIHKLKSTNQQWLRNATNPDIGLHIAKCALGVKEIRTKPKIARRF